jgi:hypothetical protein
MVFRLESLFTKAVRSERYNFYMAYIVQRKNSHPEKERRKKNRANNRKKNSCSQHARPRRCLPRGTFPIAKHPRKTCVPSCRSRAVKATERIQIELKQIVWMGSRIGRTAAGLASPHMSQPCPVAAPFVGSSTSPSHLTRASSLTSSAPRPTPLDRGRALLSATTFDLCLCVNDATVAAVSEVPPLRRIHPKRN